MCRCVCVCVCVYDMRFSVSVCLYLASECMYVDICIYVFEGRRFTVMCKRLGKIICLCLSEVYNDYYYYYY